MEFIESIEVAKEAFQLNKPYILSFETLTNFKTIFVTVKLRSGEHRTAEVVPLHGYSTETHDGIYIYLVNLKETLVGKSLIEAREIVQADILEIPFSTTAILTAIDLFTFGFNEDLVNNIDKFQFVVPSSTEKLDELVKLHKKVCLENKDTLKIKLSGNSEVDINALRVLEEEIDLNRSVIRLDANQAYNLEDGIKFFNFLNSFSKKDSILYVEQPYPVDNWDFNDQTLKECPGVSIMLDESIIGNEHIQKAHDMGVKFIKLKLYKQGGIRELIECADFAHQLGITTILGNGVAGRLTNEIEVEVFAQHSDIFHPVLEANGFLKLV